MKVKKLTEDVEYKGYMICQKPDDAELYIKKDGKLLKDENGRDLQINWMTDAKEYIDSLVESASPLKAGDKVFVTVCKKNGVVKAVSGDYITVETDNGKDPVRVDTYYANEVKKLEESSQTRSSRFNTYKRRIERAIEKGDQETLQRTKEAIMYAPAKELKNSEAAELMKMIKGAKLQEALTGYKVTIVKDGKKFDDYATAYEEAGAIQQMKNKYGDNIEVKGVAISKVIKESKSTKTFGAKGKKLNESKTGYQYKGYVICYGYKGTDRWYVKDKSDNFVGNKSGYSTEVDAKEYVDSITESLSEARDPYFTPYGYRDAAKVLNGKAPEYYYHLKEIEMEQGDGRKLANYAKKLGLNVIEDPDSDPDYPEFYIPGEYHWNDYFYPYPSAHEPKLEGFVPDDAEYERIDRSGTDDERLVAAVSYMYGVDMDTAKEYIPDLGDTQRKKALAYYDLRDLPRDVRLAKIKELYPRVRESVNPADLVDCPECGDISFDSKRGKCTKCSYTESVNEDIDYSQFRDLPDLIPYEPVEDTRKWQYSVGGVDVPYTSYEDAKAHLKDDYNIEDYREELQAYLDKETGRPHKFFVDATFDGRLCIDVHWGDWKHEHNWADYLVRKFFMDKGLGIDTEVDTTEEDGSDTYSATHYYEIDDICLSGRVVESLNEAYKDYRFYVSCNGGPSQVVRTVAADEDSAINYVKNYYSQAHSIYADDRFNKWEIKNMDEALTESDTEECWAVFATDKSTGNEYCSGVYESERWAHYWAAMDSSSDREYGYGNFSYRVEKVDDYSAELDKSRSELYKLKLANHEASKELDESAETVKRYQVEYFTDENDDSDTPLQTYVYTDSKAEAVAQVRAEYPDAQIVYCVSEVVPASYRDWDMNESKEYKVKFFQVFEAPKSPKDNGKMIGQRGTLEAANAFGKEKAGEGNYIIKAVCDDGKTRSIDNDTDPSAYTLVEAVDGAHFKVGDTFDYSGLYGGTQSCEVTEVTDDYIECRVTWTSEDNGDEVSDTTRFDIETDEQGRECAIVWRYEGEKGMIYPSSTQTNSAEMSVEDKVRSDAIEMQKMGVECNSYEEFASFMEQNGEVPTKELYDLYVSTLEEAAVMNEAADVQYGVHQFSTDSIIFRGTEEECGKYIDKNKKLWDDAEVYRMTPDDPHYKKMNEGKEPPLYVIKDSHGNQLSAPNPDDSELWDRVESMEARGRRGLMVVAYTGKKVNEASYGGAYDIADDQFFNRDDLVSFADEVLGHVSETFNGLYDIGGVWFEDGNIITLIVDDSGNEYEDTTKVDMRKIREPWHLKRAYAFIVAANIIQQIKDTNGDVISENAHGAGKYSDIFYRYLEFLQDEGKEDNIAYLASQLIRYCPDEDLKDLWNDRMNKVAATVGYNDSSINESVTDAEPIETGAAVGMAAVISDLIKDEYEAIDGYNSAIATAEAEGYGDAVKVLTEIQAEENIHIGQLQEVMKMFDPNADKVEDGQAEGAEQLNNSAETPYNNIEESADMGKERWEQIYQSFKDIETELNQDGEAVTAVVDKLYNDNKHDPDYKRAYDKWASNE